MKQFTCNICGKEFSRYCANARGKHIFCSRECYDQWQRLYHIKEQHPRWKNGITIVNGYRWVLCGNNRYEMEHRQVMESVLARKLNDDEVVHHINGDTLDNRHENLQLMTRTTHMLHHEIPAIGRAHKKKAI